jgi:CheY-like chemotaxis protein
MPGDKEEFIEAGCSYYLSKPFTRDKLFSLMKEFNL